jgi:VWFA-related protein
MARSLLIAVTSAVLTFPLLSQTNAPQEPAQPVIRTTTREVVLDLVVRDKHQHPVTDLRPDEVAVFEDGVRQNVRSFRSIRGTEQLESERTLAKGESESQPKTGEPPALNSMRQLNFVSVVFAQIAPLNLEFARRAVQEFLKSDTLPNTYVTVYTLDLNIGLIQPYTKDKDQLAKAVDVAAKSLGTRTGLNTASSVTSANLAAIQAWAANVLAQPSVGAQTQQTVQTILNDPIPAIVIDPLFIASSATQDVSVGLGNALLTQADMVKGLRFVSSEVNGMDAMDSLRALVRSEEKLPGRKVVLYLADGLQFPVNRRDAVDDLISYANRSGVSFYTVDTRGLNVDDPMMEALAAQKRTGAESAAMVNDPHNGHFEADDMQLTAVSSTQLSMRELAESTGGFAVTNTNEIALPMQRMMEDIRTHYELAYAPTSTTYDGHFRKIEVRVTRPKLTVQTRKGYYAVPDLNGEPLQPYELLALNALNEHPAEPVFPYEFAAMKFRPEAKAVEYEVTFEIPLAGLKAVTDATTGLAHYQAGLVAFIHDATGQVVTKVSRELARDITKEASPDLAKARILYAEPIELPPGRYVVDAAVTDEPSGKTSVKRVSLFVDPGKDLSLSSLELVRRFEPLTGPRNPGSPFELENGRITPTLTGAAAAGIPMSVYFVVYPGKPAGAETPNVTVEVIRDGKEIARKPLNLATPDVDGSIPMLVQLSPGVGQCDVLVTAKQGTTVAQSSLSVRVE